MTHFHSNTQAQQIFSPDSLIHRSDSSLFSKPDSSPIYLTSYQNSIPCPPLKSPHSSFTPYKAAKQLTKPIDNILENRIPAAVGEEQIRELGSFDYGGMREREGFWFRRWWGSGFGSDTTNDDDDDDDEYEEVEEEESLPRVSDSGQGSAGDKEKQRRVERGFQIVQGCQWNRSEIDSLFCPICMASFDYQDVVMDDSRGDVQSGLGVMLILVNGDRIWISWFDDDDDDDDGFC
ncbi:hypothetical protein Q3G72_000918 [Acer saccharum]|nr:hypothetical protein Q3G72_000918 [Acer saccharum]